MIRINLLPVRAAKKRESIRFQLTVAGLITFCVIAISLAVFLKLKSDASLLRQDVESAEAELRMLQKKVGELSKLKEQKRIVQSKLDVVKRLESARTGPVELFAKIATAIPERAWLSSLLDQGKVISLQGLAGSDEVVADFMRGLERYRELGDVELVVAQRSKVTIGGRELVEFTIRLERE